MDDNDDVLFFVDLPDEKVCFKVRKIPEYERKRWPCEAIQNITNMVYDVPKPTTED